jgi:hypothetical protein
MRLLHWSWLRNDQIPSSLKNAAAERDRFPFPLSAARIALTVVALGIRKTRADSWWLRRSLSAKARARRKFLRIALNRICAQGTPEFPCAQPAHRPGGRAKDQ